MPINQFDFVNEIDYFNAINFNPSYLGVNVFIGLHKRYV